MNHAQDEHALKPSINVTPMIDILLVLLIIFMVVSPLKPSRFKALIPQEPERNDQVQPNTTTLVVTIANDLQLSLNGESSLGSVNDTAPLSTRLATLFSERTANRAFRYDMITRSDLPEVERIEKTVFIKAPRSLAYSTLR